MVSDHPVVAYNRFAEVHPSFRHVQGCAGIALKGLQLFLPISPHECIAAYDSDVYAYGSGAEWEVDVSASDVMAINTMQAINAENCLFLPPAGPPERYIKRLLRARERHPPLRQAQWVVQPVPVASGQSPRELVSFSGTDIRFDASLSFVRIVDEGLYLGFSRLPIRSPELHLLAAEFEQEKLAEAASAEREPDAVPSLTVGPD